MEKSGPPMLHGDVLSVQPYPVEHAGDLEAGRTFVLEVVDEATTRTLMASLPLLDRLLAEKIAEVRERQMAEMVDFMAARMLTPSSVEMQMAQRLARRHARILNEYGYFTAEQLADANGSQAGNRAALADNWRKRRQVFAVPHPDRAARDRDVYPAFQFEDARPIRVVHEVLEAFQGRKAPWKLAMWFTSNNGGLPASARPVELLLSHPDQVVLAAKRDARESAA